MCFLIHYKEYSRVGMCWKRRRLIPEKIHDLTAKWDLQWIFVPTGGNSRSADSLGFFFTSLDPSALPTPQHPLSTSLNLLLRPKTTQTTLWRKKKKQKKQQ